MLYWSLEKGLPSENLKLNSRILWLQCTRFYIPSFESIHQFVIVHIMNGLCLPQIFVYYSKNVYSCRGRLPTIRHSEHVIVIIIDDQHKLLQYCASVLMNSRRLQTSLLDLGHQI